MLTSLIALVACSQGGQTLPPAAPIVSKMIAHYMRPKPW